MERLIADANEWAEANGKAANLSIDSFSDVVTAIDYVQQKQGVAGTTAREAASTVSGSIGMLKSAWENLITGMSDKDADLTKLINNVVESAKAVVKNIMPVVEQSLSGISQLFSEAAPMVIKEIPKLVSLILPELAKAITSTFIAIVKSIPELAKTLFATFGQVFQEVVKLLPELWTEITTALSELFSQIDDISGSAMDSVGKFIENIASFITQNAPKMVNAFVSGITGFIQWVADNATALMPSSLALIESLANGIISAIPILIDALPNIINTIVNFILENLPQILETGINILFALVDGLLDALPNLIQAMADIVMNLVASIAQNYPKFLTLGYELIVKLVMGLVKALPKTLEVILATFTAIPKAIMKIDWIEVGKNVIKGIVEGFKKLKNLIGDSLLDIMDGGVKKVKNFFGIHSPSRKMRDEVGQWIPKGMAVGITENAKAVEDAMGELEEIPNKYGSNGSESDIMGGGKSSGAGAGGNTVYNINVNQPVSTPAEMADAIRIESQYGLIEGVPI